MEEDVDVPALFFSPDAVVPFQRRYWRPELNGPAYRHYKVCALAPHPSQRIFVPPVDVWIGRYPESGTRKSVRAGTTTNAKKETTATIV